MQGARKKCKNGNGGWAVEAKAGRATKEKRSEAMREQEQQGNEIKRIRATWRRRANQIEK